MTDMLEFVEDVTESELTNFFIEDPRLAYLALSDTDLTQLHEEKRLGKSYNSAYFKVTKKDEIVSIIKCEKFSELAACTHLYIKSKYHHTGLYPKVCDLLVNHILAVTDFKKIILTVPKPCEHVGRAAVKYGMRLGAELENIVIWRQKPVNLLYYTLDIR